MKTEAIMVNEKNGYYEINQNADTESWKEIKRHAHVRKIESLTGWGHWKSAYWVEMPHSRQCYFVSSEPAS